VSGLRFSFSPLNWRYSSVVIYSPIVLKELGLIIGPPREEKTSCRSKHSSGTPTKEIQ
jgi:hypothetical protein